MAKKIFFPFDQSYFFSETECMESALQQGVSLSSLDVRKANVILDLASKLFEVPRNIIVEHNRKREACFGRILFASTLLPLTGLPLNCVGGFLNGRDHSTVNFMMKTHYQNIASKDHAFDVYKSAVAAMGSFMEKAVSETDFQTQVSIITEKVRVNDLLMFAQSFGMPNVTEQLVIDYVRNHGL